MEGARRHPWPSGCTSGGLSCRSGAAGGSSQPSSQKRCWARVLLVGLLAFSAGIARAGRARILAEAIELGRVMEMEEELTSALSEVTAMEHRAAAAKALAAAPAPAQGQSGAARDPGDVAPSTVAPPATFSLDEADSGLDSSPGAHSAAAAGEAEAAVRSELPEQSYLQSGAGRESVRTQAQASHNHTLPSLHIVTALYRKPEGLHDGVCNSLGSMLLMGFNVTVLTWEWAETRLPEATRAIKAGEVLLQHTFKILLFREWLRTEVEKEHEAQPGKGTGTKDSWDGTTVQVLVDGSDVIFQQDPHELATSLVSIMNSTHPIVASAQKTCYPLAVIGLETCRTAPRSPYEAAYILHNSTADPLWQGAHNGAPRWLNSGAVSGPASDLLRILDTATSEELAGFSDQAMLLRRYLTSQGAGGIQMDFAGALAHTVWRGKEDIERIPGSRPLKMRNKVTGAVPGIIHFAGDDKVIEEKWTITGYLRARIKRALKGNKQLPGRLFHGNGTSMDFADWCSGWP